MERNSNAGNAEPGAQQLKITRKIPLGRARAACRGKHPVGQVTKKQLAQLDSHWYETMYISLAVDPEKQVVEVHIRAPQAQQLLHPHTCIKGCQCGQPGARFVTPDGLPVYYPVDLFRGEGDSEFLLFLQPLNPDSFLFMFDMQPVEIGADPPKVRFNRNRRDSPVTEFADSFAICCRSPMAPAKALNAKPYGSSVATETFRMYRSSVIKSFLCHFSPLNGYGEVVLTTRQETAKSLKTGARSSVG
jgi:hypothetical protein